VNLSVALDDVVVDQPLLELALVPGGIDSIGGTIVVVLHQIQVLVALGLIRALDDSVSDQPFVL
jgi:hypothetical protein